MLKRYLRSNGFDKVWWLLSFILFISSVFYFVPFDPGVPTDGLDPSWKAAISYAVDHHMPIGERVVFTFGPLANVYTGYHSETYGLGYIAVALYIAACFTLGVIACVRRERRFVVLIGVSIISLLWGNLKDPLLMIIPFLSSFILLLMDKEPKSAGRFESVVVLLMLPVLGLLPLIKLSVIAASVLCAVVNSAFCVYKRKLILAMCSLIIPSLSFVCMWVLFGQPIGAIPSYLLNSGPIISGYTEAMSIYNTLLLPALYVVTAGVLLLTVWNKRRLQTVTTFISIALLAAYFFFAFKAGFVRDDGHAQISGVALMIGTLIAWPLFNSLRGLGVSSVVILSGVAIVSANYTFNPKNIISNAAGRVKANAHSLTLRLQDYDKFSSDYRARVKDIARSASLPEVSGGTDIYSYGQAGVIASGMDWQPRPVIQSYSAYTPALLKMNADYLLSGKAPKNIFFSLQAIDNRLPSLEDGLSWMPLLNLYAPASAAHGNLVLVRSTEQVPAFTEISQHIERLGQAVDVPDSTENVYVTIDINPSLYGRLKSTLFKPSQLMMRVKLRNGDVKEYRVISGMMKTQFLLSPLIESTHEFMSLYAGGSLLDGKKVKSFELYTPGRGMDWQGSFGVKFYSAPSTFRESAVSLLNIARPELITPPESSSCVGAFDTIGGFSDKATVLTAKEYLAIKGWNTPDVENYPSEGQNVIFLSDAERTYAYRLKASLRPDVAVHFKSPSMVDSGYDALLDLRDLRGVFKISVGFRRGQQIVKCNEASTQLTIE